MTKQGYKETAGRGQTFSLPIWGLNRREGNRAEHMPTKGKKRKQKTLLKQRVRRNSWSKTS